MQNNVSNKKDLQFYQQCPVIAEASDFPRTFPNMSKRSFSLTLIGAYFSLREIRIWSFANGYDDSPVKLENTYAPIKSVGNSITTPKDLVCDEDVKIVLYILAESVAARLRRRLALRGGNGAEQSNQIMSGVCGHWVRSFQASHRPCPASGAGFRRGQRC